MRRTLPWCSPGAGTYGTQDAGTCPARLRHDAYVQVHVHVHVHVNTRARQARIAQSTPKPESMPTIEAGKARPTPSSARLSAACRV